MFNKKSTLFIGLLLLCLIGRTQQRTIEVTVTDTVLVKATQFVYTILPDEQGAMEQDTAAYSGFKTYKLQKISMEKLQKMRIDSLAASLKNKGFTVLGIPVETRYVLFDGANFSALQVATQSLDSLRLLYNLVKENVFFNGYVSSRKTASETPYKKRLFEKALAAARAKAMLVAEAGKLFLGDILSIKEVEKETGWVAYPPLSALSNLSRGYPVTDNDVKNIEDYYTLPVTLVVTFVAR